MPEFPQLPIVTPPPRQDPKFPELPLLDPDPPRMSLRDKYGGLYYAAIGGLIASVLLIGNFFVQFYRQSDFWFAFAIVANPQLDDGTRDHAAWTIAHSPHANDLQKYDLALRRDLPELARYILAEGLTAEAIQADPKAYALMVARSEPWPDWLRLMMARPMAYAVGEGYRIAWEPLDELRRRSDRAMVLWMTYTRAVMGPGDATIGRQLRDAAGQPGPYQGLAALLVAAMDKSGAERAAKLDEATAWLRANHPPCAQVWDGYEVRDGQLVARVNGPASPPAPSPAPAPLPAPTSPPGDGKGRPPG